MSQILGHVLLSDGTPVSQVKVQFNLHGGGTYWDMTNANGKYDKTDLPIGTYDVQPFKIGLTFAPVLAVVTTGGGPVTRDFVATVASGHTINGTVLLNGVGVAGVVVSTNTGLSGGTGTDGKYAIMGVPDGTYTLTPQPGSYTFVPTTLSVTVAAADLFNKDFAATAANAFSISGTILDGSANPISGINVTAGGISVMTGADGTYSIPGLAPGTYSVVPSSSAGTFAPTSITAVITTANLTGQDFTFTAAAGTHTISGTITGVGVEGVTVSTDTGLSAVSDAGGLYTIYGVPDNHTYVLTPRLGGFTYAPTTLSAVMVTTNLTGKNFVGSAGGGAYKITGSVVDGNATPLAGAAVTATVGGVPYVATTNAAGTYSIEGLANGSYVVVCVLAGYTFTPTSRAVTLTGGDVTGQDFTAATSTATYDISGSVLDSTGAALPGVLVYAGTLMTTTDAAGAYTLEDVEPGIAVVVPALEGWVFSPTYRNVSIINAAVTGVDFTAYVDIPDSSDLPHILVNKSGTVSESIDADVTNENNAFLLAQARSIDNSKVKVGASISASKIASGLTPPLANLRADEQYVQQKLKEMDEKIAASDTFSAWSQLLPEDVDLEVVGVGNSGSGGYLDVRAGKTLRMDGKELSTDSARVPTGATSYLAAESIYALRAEVVEGALSWKLVPLYGKALAAGDTESKEHVLAEFGTVTSGSKFLITVSSGTPLMGARGISLGGTAAGEEFDVSYFDPSASGLTMLSEALTSAPTAADIVAFRLDHPDYRDAIGTLGGPSSPTSALIALVYCGEAGTQPVVKKQPNKGGAGQPRVIELPWTDVLNLNLGASAANSQAIPFTSPGCPIRALWGFCTLYDKNPASFPPTDATGVYFGPLPVEALSVDGTTAKGTNIRIAPDSITVRVSDGHMAIINADGTLTIAKAGRFRVYLEY